MRQGCGLRVLDLPHNMLFIEFFAGRNGFGSGDVLASAPGPT